MSAHSSRFRNHHEVRYLLSEDSAARMRDFVLEYLDIDELCVGRAGFVIPVETVYLDSPELTFFWETILRPECNYQLRMRYHQNASGKPVILEIKRRHGDGVVKEEFTVSAEGAERIVAGELPEQDPLLQGNCLGLFAAEHFWELMENHHMRPTVRLAYGREAYRDLDGSVRLNFDRHLRATPLAPCPPSLNLAAHWRMPGSKVILELKFADRFPHWFRQMVERFNLVESDFCKYRTALTALGANPNGALG